MNDESLLKLLNRINNNFYVGVVGSVRCGKSLFIKRFMELKVLPHINNSILKDKIIDELPQSSDGKSIMTVEPKFIPSNEISITVDGMNLNVRLVDSVGYVIPSALGYYTDEGPRYVKTPWFSEPIPFKEAALIGTKKVITNHSTLGILMTSDGSIGDFTKEDYLSVLDEMVEELKKLDKPFVIVVNSTRPNGSEAKKMCDDLMQKYNVSTIAISALDMTENDIDNILLLALNEFDILELNIKIPSYIESLSDNNKYKIYFNQMIKDTVTQYKKFKDIDLIKNRLSEYDHVNKVVIEEIDPSIGLATICIEIDNSVYDDILNDLLGDVKTKGEFITMIEKYKEAYEGYKAYKQAILEANSSGYGITYPTKEDLILETPEMIKEGSRYGVKIKATAPCIHMIKIDVSSVFEPIIGSMEQTQSFIETLKNEKDIWDLEIFGRKISDCLNDGIKYKINSYPAKAREKLGVTLGKIVNNSQGGMIAIIL